MTATSRLRLQRLLPQLFIACLLLVAQSAAGHRVGRKLQQTKRHTLNLAWTVRGSCSSSFLKNATYDFELAVAQASLDDLKRAVPAGNVVFMDYGNTARGGTSCKDLQVDWTDSPFAGYYFSYQFTATQSVMEQLRTDARRGKGFGLAEPNTYSASLLVPQQQLPRQPGGNTRRMRAAFANNRDQPDYQSTLEYAFPLAPQNPNPPPDPPTPPPPVPSTPSPSPLPSTCATANNGLPFNCSVNTSLKPNPSSITSPTQASCCTLNPSCQTAVNGTSPFPCAAGTQLKTNASQIFNLTQGACCDFTPTCANSGSGVPFQCNNGTLLNPNASSILQPNQTVCCATPTCANGGVNATAWSCPTNTSPKANWSSISPPNNTQCCVGADLNCGSYNGTNATFPCSAGTSIRANASSIYGANQTTCCVANTCAASLINGTLAPWPCPNNTVLKLNATGIYPPNATACCAAAVTCGSGNIYTNATNVTTTGPWQCPSGYSFRANSTNVAPPSNAACCDLIAPNCTSIKNSVYNPNSNKCECTTTGFTIPTVAIGGAAITECLASSTVSCPAGYQVAARQANGALAMCLADGTTTCPSNYTLSMFSGNPSTLTECRPAIQLPTAGVCAPYTDYMPIWNDTTQITTLVGCVKAVDNVCPYVAYRSYTNGFAMQECRVTSRCPAITDTPSSPYQVAAKGASGQLLSCLVLDPSSQRCPTVQNVVNAPVVVTNNGLTPNSGCGGTSSNPAQCLTAVTVECWVAGITSCPPTYPTQLRAVTSSGSSYIIGCRSLKTGAISPATATCDYTASLMTPSSTLNNADPNAGSYTVALVNTTLNILVGCIAQGATMCPPDFPLATINSGNLVECKSSGSSTAQCSAGQIPGYNVAGNLEACFSATSCPNDYPITVRSTPSIRCLARGSVCPSDYSTPFYAPFSVNGTTTTLLTNCFPTAYATTLVSCSQPIGDGPTGTTGLYNIPIGRNITAAAGLQGPIIGCMLGGSVTPLTVCPADYPFAVYSSGNTIDACGPLGQTCNVTQITLQDQNNIVGCTGLGASCPSAYPIYVSQSLISPTYVQCLSSKTTCGQAYGASPTAGFYFFTLVNGTSTKGCVSNPFIANCNASITANAGYNGTALMDLNGNLQGCTTPNSDKVCPLAFPLPIVSTDGNFDQCRSGLTSCTTVTGYPTPIYNSANQLVSCSATTTGCGSGVIVASGFNVGGTVTVDKCLDMSTTTCPPGTVNDPSDRSFPLYKGTDSLGVAKLYMCTKTPTLSGLAATDCSTFQPFGYSVPTYNVVDRSSNSVAVKGCVSTVEVTPCPPSNPFYYLDGDANIVECRYSRTGSPATCNAPDVSGGTPFSSYNVKLTNDVGTLLFGCMLTTAVACPTFSSGSKAYNFPFFLLDAQNTVAECRRSQPLYACGVFSSFTPGDGVQGSYTIPAYLGTTVGTTGSISGCIDTRIPSCSPATGYGITWVKSDNTIGGCYPSLINACPGSGPTIPLQDVTGTTLQGCSELASACPTSWPIQAVSSVPLTPMSRTGIIEACWAASASSACSSTYPIALCANSTAPGNIAINAGISACSGGSSKLQGCLEASSPACPSTYPFPVSAIVDAATVSIKACYLSDGGATTCGGPTYNTDVQNTLLSTKLVGCANPSLLQLAACVTAELVYFGLSAGNSTGVITCSL